MGVSAIKSPPGTRTRAHANHVGKHTERKMLHDVEHRNGTERVILAGCEDVHQITHVCTQPRSSAFVDAAHIGVDSPSGNAVFCENTEPLTPTGTQVEQRVCLVDDVGKEWEIPLLANPDLGRVAPEAILDGEIQEIVDLRRRGRYHTHRSPGGCRSIPHGSLETLDGSLCPSELDPELSQSLLRGT